MPLGILRRFQAKKMQFFLRFLLWLDISETPPIVFTLTLNSYEYVLKSSWMICEDLRRNTLAWYTCPEQCINVWLRPEDHQLRLENFYAPSFPQMGHWNSVLCSRLNLDSTMNLFSFQIIKEIF